jgi:phage conserved hypothetical protein, C-terminal domain
MQTEDSIGLGVIIQHLNEKTGSSFRASSASTKKPIMARLNEGYQIADFWGVIDEKSSQWLGNETMERYLRPQTLFGNKFESYLQEARRKATKPKDAGISGFRDAKELLE